MHEISKEEAPWLFFYVFLGTTAVILLTYFISLLIFHCVFWPKILAKIKADKPVQTAKQEQLLQKLAVGRTIQVEDKTQSELSATPETFDIERTQSAEDFFKVAGPVVSENESLIGDKTPRSARSMETAKVTAAPAASPQLGLQTAKESRQTKGRRWFEDDMMTTGMEILQPRSKDQSKDQRRRSKEKQQKGSGSENNGHLRTGRELKKGGRTTRKVHRFNDDTRTCVEKLPLLSQSLEDAKKSTEEQKRSEELRRRKRTPSNGAKDQQQPRSIYAFEVEPKESKDPKEPKEPKEHRGTERRVGTKNQGGTTMTAASKSMDKSKEPPERLLDLCKTQDD